MINKNISVIQELNKELVFKQSDKRETIENLNKWLLFDSASTTNLFNNKKLVKNIRPSKKTKRVISNGGELSIHQKTDITGLGPVPFSKNGIVNLVSMAVLIDSGFRVFFDSVIEDAIFLFINNNRILKFERSENGLYFHNTENC